MSTLKAPKMSRDVLDWRRASVRECRVPPRSSLVLPLSRHVDVAFGEITNPTITSEIFANLGVARPILAHNLITSSSSAAVDLTRDSSNQNSMQPARPTDRSLVNSGFSGRVVDSRRLDRSATE